MELSFPHTVTVIIPTFNEEGGIERTIESISRANITSIGYKLEVIVVDFKSSDLTRQVAHKLGAKVIVERREGYGRAIKTGMKVASGDVIVTLDGDSSYPAGLIPALLQYLNDENLDFITVNRFSNIEKGAMSLTHIIGNKILTVFMRLLYSVDVHDSQSGMWVMKKSFVDQISVRSDSMSFSEEIKIVAFRFFKSAEVKGSYFNRIGQPKLQTIKHGWRNLKFLFSYRPHLQTAVRVPNLQESQAVYQEASQLQIEQRKLHPLP